MKLPEMLKEDLEELAREDLEPGPSAKWMNGHNTTCFKGIDKRNQVDSLAQIRL